MSQANLQHFSLQGIACAACVKTLSQALDQSPDIQHYAINFADRTAIFDSQLPAAEISALVKQAGYGATLIESPADLLQQQQAEAAENRRQIYKALVMLGLGALLMALMMAGVVPPLHLGSGVVASLVTAGLTLAAVSWSAGHIYQSAWRQLKHRSFTMETLISLGTGSAWLYSFGITLWVLWVGLEPSSGPQIHLYYDAVFMVLGFVLLGQGIEGRARRHTSEAIRALMQLTPETALRVRDGELETVPLALVVAGDLVSVLPGARVPLDGVVVEGESFIDESMLTGEPVPRRRTQGDRVVGGTLNGQSDLLVQVASTGDETVLARILAAVRDAQMSKPPLAQLADKIASVFVPTVIVIALLAATAWLIFGPAPQAQYAVTALMSVLIIACPCALGLATPLSVMVGTGRAAKRGILIREGAALQRAHQVDRVVFDKTGTLTQGMPEVTASQFHLDDVNYGDGPLTEQTLHSLIRRIEERSEHPLAQAVLASLSQDAREKLPILGFKALLGLGVQAKSKGQLCRIGSVEFLQQQGISLGAFETFITHADRQGQSPIMVSLDDKAVAAFLVTDPLRAESAAVVAALRKAGVKTTLLSGDRPTVVASVAQQLSVDEAYGGLSPDQKLAQIEAYQASGEAVLMVGDGINDAPSLAQADVGVAMGSGTDIAVASADVSLLATDLNRLMALISISADTVRNIKQNLFAAFIYNLLMIPLAAGVFYASFDLWINPMFAGAAMALSSITVVANSNRLLKR